MVEYVDFADAEHVRRRFSIDFSVPSVRRPGGWIEAIPYVPVMLIRKQELTRFLVTDKSGSPLPVLTRAENGRIAFRMLLQHAISTSWWAALSKQAKIELGMHLRELATQPHSSDRFDALFPPADGGAAHVWSSDTRFRNFAARLAESFVLFVGQEAGEAGRRVLDVKYDTTVPSRFDGRRLASTLGIAAVPFDIDIAQECITAPSSYHIELTVPEGIVFGEAHITRDGRRLAGTSASPASSQRRQHFHVTLSDEDPSRGVIPAFGVAVGLRLDSSGSPRTGMLVSVLVLGMLTAGLGLHLGGKHLQSGADAAAIAVSFVGLLAGFVGGSSGHPVTAKLNGGQMFLIGVLAISSFAAAGVLVVDVGSFTRVAIWAIGAFIAAASFVVHAVSWHRGRRMSR